MSSFGICFVATVEKRFCGEPRMLHEKTHGVRSYPDDLKQVIP